MIGLDSNVIIRHLTQDDPVQSPKATEVFERRLTQRNPGFVSVVAIVETAWVLERAYGFGDNDIARAIERLLGTDVLVFQDEDAVFTALTALQARLGSFADALIGVLGSKAGCSLTLTFDARAARLPAFELL